MVPGNCPAGVVALRTGPSSAESMRGKASLEGSNAESGSGTAPRSESPPSPPPGARRKVTRPRTSVKLRRRLKLPRDVTGETFAHVVDHLHRQVDELIGEARVAHRDRPAGVGGAGRRGGHGRHRCGVV